MLCEASPIPDHCVGVPEARRDLAPFHERNHFQLRSLHKIPGLHHWINGFKVGGARVWLAVRYIPPSLSPSLPSALGTLPVVRIVEGALFGIVAIARNLLTLDSVVSVILVSKPQDSTVSNLQ